MTMMLCAPLGALMKWPEITMPATTAPARTGGERRKPSTPRLGLEDESRRLGAHLSAALTASWLPRLES